MAPPIKEIDVTRLREYAYHGLSDRQIGLLLNISTSTLAKYRRIMQYERARLEDDLRAAMITKGIVERNPTVLLWLSKNLLKWSDRVSYSDESTTPKAVKVEWSHSPDATPPPPATPSSVLRNPTPNSEGGKTVGEDAPSQPPSPGSPSNA